MYPQQETRRRGEGRHTDGDVYGLKLMKGIALVHLHCQLHVSQFFGIPSEVIFLAEVLHVMLPGHRQSYIFPRDPSTHPTPHQCDHEEELLQPGLFSHGRKRRFFAPLKQGGLPCNASPGNHRNLKSPLGPFFG
jgi:hypothetical protein